jgi:hypothetical protein
VGSIPENERRTLSGSSTTTVPPTTQGNYWPMVHQPPFPVLDVDQPNRGNRGAKNTEVEHDSITEKLERIDLGFLTVQE